MPVTPRCSAVRCSRPSTEALAPRRAGRCCSLNRRGMATVVLCRVCGSVRICPNCSIPLVYHEDRGLLICHRCDHRERPTRECPLCAGPLDYFGAGTQRVEAEAKHLFTDARVSRWDQDVARRRGGNAAILQAIERREVDIVIGTQLIAKGSRPAVCHHSRHHECRCRAAFSGFSVRRADVPADYADGGPGGGRTPGSRVIVQTYSPDHYVLTGCRQS